MRILYQGSREAREQKLQRSWFSVETCGEDLSLVRNPSMEVKGQRVCVVF
jgi:hypothetical protein